MAEKQEKAGIFHFGRFASSFPRQIFELYDNSEVVVVGKDGSLNHIRRQKNKQLPPIHDLFTENDDVGLVMAYSAIREKLKPHQCGFIFAIEGKWTTKTFDDEPDSDDDDDESDIKSESSIEEDVSDPEESRKRTHSGRIKKKKRPLTKAERAVLRMTVANFFEHYANTTTNFQPSVEELFDGYLQFCEDSNYYFPRVSCEQQIGLRVKQLGFPKPDRGMYGVRRYELKSREVLLEAVGRYRKKYRIVATEKPAAIEGDHRSIVLAFLHNFASRERTKWLVQVDSFFKIFNDWCRRNDIGIEMSAADLEREINAIGFYKGCLSDDPKDDFYDFNSWEHLAQTISRQEESKCLSTAEEKAEPK